MGKRMFSTKITDSDAFIELSSSAQALYFHLNQGADDDGFNNQIQNALFKSHATTDDLKILIAKNFIIRFESGVIVIKHWRIHNTLRKDRYHPTNFQEELNILGIKDNGSYTLSNGGCQVVAKRLPDGCPSIDKIRLDKNNIEEKEIYKEKERKKPTLEEVREYCKERNNNVDAESFIDFYESKDWMIGKNKMKDWKAAVRTWEKRKQPQREATIPKWFNKKIDTQELTKEELKDLEWLDGV